MSDLEDRIAAGREVYARDFGVSPEQAETLMSAQVGLEYTHEAYLAAGGGGWQSPHLTDRDRSIAVIAALVSQQVINERLTACLTAARNNGVTEDGLNALMILLTAYLGQLAASAALTAIRRSAPS